MMEKLIEYLKLRFLPSLRHFSGRISDRLNRLSLRDRKLAIIALLTFIALAASAQLCLAWLRYGELKAEKERIENSSLEKP